MRISSTIWVYADWAEIGKPTLMGKMLVDPGREEVFSFTYDPAWLASAWSRQIDPDLHLYDGPQYPTKGKPNFGIFSDSAPDRWGRMLMQRKEAYEADKQKRAYRKFRESDFLLGVRDLTRMGALRFKKNPDGPFLDDNTDLPAPPITQLRELETASLHLEELKAESKRNYAHWLQLLLAPGSSLGGARPKASVIDPAADLWIAKFPSKGDNNDTGAWEAVVNHLAKGAGLNISEDDGRMSFELALSVADKFRLNQKDAKAFVSEIQRSVANWKKVAEQFGITRADINSMAPAFSLDGKD